MEREVGEKKDIATTSTRGVDEVLILSARAINGLHLPSPFSSPRILNSGRVSKRAKNPIDSSSCFLGRVSSN